MRVRSLGVSTEWLGGTARRWVALVGLAATALGIVSFALSEDLSWAWLAIGSLLLLVVSLGSELWMVQHRMAAHQRPLLDRAIADGHALLTISDHTSFVMQWDRHWRPETYEMLRREFGCRLRSTSLTRWTRCCVRQVGKTLGHGQAHRSSAWRGCGREWRAPEGSSEARSPALRPRAGATTCALSVSELIRLLPPPVTVKIERRVA